MRVLTSIAVIPVLFVGWQLWADGTNECHRGERLDLHPETPDFPTEFPIVPPGGLGRFSPQ